MKYYLDSCIVIYIVERITDYREQLIHLIPEDSELLVSDLTRMECRCKPIQTKNTQLLEEFDFFFNESADTINLTTEVIDKATEIRAAYSFKTPDSIHLACSVIGKANFFVTNDKRLNAFTEVKVLCL
ncbi:MAG: type II toxin-antitoxin system VapC family toxin [Leptospiraceae bacterium]|nr:type II toxin-antitoxin system VapC family toxin [Leptospiraceae bacterium]